MTNTGVQMLMKAMGFDPQVVIAKAQELEQVFQQFGVEVTAKVEAIDARMARMEEMLVQILNGQQQQGGPVSMAGECNPALYLPPAQIAAVEAEQEQEKTNGRYTGDSSSARRTRKAS